MIRPSTSAGESAADDRLALGGAPRPAPLLAARGLVKTFGRGPLGDRGITALADVSLVLDAGEMVALVGGSGSGKTTLARCLIGQLAPDAGEVWLDGAPLLARRGAAFRAVRRRVQLVAQDAAAALNPRLRVADALREPLCADAAALPSPSSLAARVARLLDEVGLPRALAGRYPHELSGGERQRVVIARALSVEPCALIADEPVASLDLIKQEHVLDLLCRLQRERGLACLLISHDLLAVAAVATRLAVMQAGRIVETGATATMLRAPTHDYTRALCAAVPRLDGSTKALREMPDTNAGL